MKRLTKGSKQLTLDKYKSSISSDTSLTQPTQTVTKVKDEWICCKGCNRRRKLFDKSEHICRMCHKLTIPKQQEK
jgi:hypothetical protein